jgi:hypothetical protein
MRNGQSWPALIEDGFAIDIRHLDVPVVASGCPDGDLPQDQPQLWPKGVGDMKLP